MQLATPGFLQGRVGGLFNYVVFASGPPGSLLAGWLSQRWGAPCAFLVGGAVTLAMALGGLVLRPWPLPTGSVRVRRKSFAGARSRRT